MPSPSARAVLRSLPADTRGRLTFGGASCDCAYSRRSYSSEPGEYGDEAANGLALWYVSADLPTVPAGHSTVTVDDETWRVRSVNRASFGLTRLELE